MSTTKQLTPQKLNNELSTAPEGNPKYFETVKDQTGKEVTLGSPQATRALLCLMNMAAVNGGAACHWGGPSAFAEIMSSIHGIMFKNKNWFDHFNFVNDAGHTENGIYALRANLGFDQLNFESLLKFRSISSPLTGHGEAHVNPSQVLISNGPLGSGVPQAQGLAMADKVAGNKRVTLCTVSDGACMEGEAKESFSAIPGLAAKNQLNPFVLIVSYNNKKLSGEIENDSFSMNPTIESFKTLGWTVYEESAGHDLQKVYTQVENSIQKASNNPEKPICLIVHTIKGAGIKETENQPSGGHGYPLKKHDSKLQSYLQELYDEKCPDEFLSMANQLTTVPENKDASSITSTDVPKEKVQAGVAKALIKAAENNLPVFSLSADLQSSTGVKAFHQKYPERFIEVGVAESNMISTAIGFSKAGFIPVVDTFAQFGVTKGNLPLTMASLSEAPIVAIFSHTGLQDAADGASHQATTYFSAVSSIPNFDVICASCSSEAEALLYQGLNNIYEARKQGKAPRSLILFIGRENFLQTYSQNANYRWKKAQILKKPESPKALLVATGPMVSEALKAAEQLETEGTSVTVINNAFVNNPDLESISKELAFAQGNLITVEDHQAKGGMGEILSSSLLAKGETFRVNSLGIPDSFGRSAYNAQELYKKYGISSEYIVTSVKKLCGK